MQEGGLCRKEDYVGRRTRCRKEDQMQEGGLDAGRRTRCRKDD